MDVLIHVVVERIIALRFFHNRKEFCEAEVQFLPDGKVIDVVVPISNKRRDPWGVFRRVEVCGVDKFEGGRRARGIECAALNR